VLQVVNMSTDKKRKSRGKRCSVYGCTNCQYDKEGVFSTVNFFQIPKSIIEKKSLRDRWGSLIKRQDGKDKFRLETAHICSQHFHPDDVTKSLNGKRGIKPGSEPSIFEWNAACVGREAPKDQSTREPFADLPTAQADEQIYLEPDYEQVTICITIYNSYFNLKYDGHNCLSYDDRLGLR
jgi:hypothetical protein